MEVGARQSPRPRGGVVWPAPEGGGRCSACCSPLNAPGAGRRRPDLERLSSRARSMAVIGAASRVSPAPLGRGELFPAAGASPRWWRWQRRRRRVGSALPPGLGLLGLVFSRFCCSKCNFFLPEAGGRAEKEEERGNPSRSGVGGCGRVGGNFVREPGGSETGRPLGPAGGAETVTRAGRGPLPVARSLPAARSAPRRHCPWRGGEVCAPPFGAALPAPVRSPLPAGGGGHRTGSAGASVSVGCPLDSPCCRFCRFPSNEG